jgi:hypothetical protein
MDRDSFAGRFRALPGRHVDLKGDRRPHQFRQNSPRNDASMEDMSAFGATSDRFNQDSIINYQLDLG